MKASTPRDTVIAWLRNHQDVAAQAQAIGEAQRGIMRVLDDRVPAAERRRQRLACCDHLWCGVRAAVADAMDEQEPPLMAAEAVIDDRKREGRKHVADASVYAAAEAVWGLCPRGPQGRRALAILAAVNCPDLNAHDAVARVALKEIR